MRVTTTISKATKESPSMLLFDVRQQGSVVDRLLDALEAGEYTDVSRDLIKTREQASDRMQEREANKRAYDRKHKSPGKYAIGDRVVMIRNFDCTPGSSQKLISHYKGPYQISRVEKRSLCIVRRRDPSTNEHSLLRYMGGGEYTIVEAILI